MGILGRLVHEPAPPILHLAEQFQSCRLRGDWEGMRELLHPDSRLESLAAPDQTLLADELVAAIKEAAAHGLYSVPAWLPELIDPHTVLVEGRVRYRVGKAGFTDESRIWLTTDRDGLIWRMKIFHGRREAIEWLHAHGPDLGL